jgi:O-antigen ligase
LKTTLAIDKPAAGRSPQQKEPHRRQLIPGAGYDRLALMAGLSLVPISIAASEFFLSIAVVARTARLARRQTRMHLPHCFWFWLLWTGLEFVVWAQSSRPALGWSEIRHTILIGGLFAALPALDMKADYRTVWKGILITSSLSSLFLIGEFFWRLFHYRREISAGGDAGFYLRSGGLLHHWMVYGTVEILVVAGLLSFWSVYPEERRRWWPAACINGVAVLLSLTRMAWITCLLLLGIDLIWRRPRWILALPLLPVALYFLAPSGVRLRLTESSDPAYYSNSERLQMLQVGWRMVRDHPLAGVGPGRVESLYTSYLAPQEPVPAYHGHLHNNIVQTAAQFGIPVTLAALLFVGVLFRDILKLGKAANGRDDRFAARTALLALTGFVFAGFFEYTYGHSLALILLSFAVLPALQTDSR